VKLAYRAYDRQGREVADTIEAAHAAEAADMLRRKGLFATQIDDAAKAAAAGAARQRKGLRRTRRMKHLAMFARQLHVLVSSGTQIVQALRALEKQITQPAWRRVVGDVRSQVERGSSLSEAMARHADCFDGISRSMVAAGEAGGTLPEMLDRLAGLLESRLHVRRTIIAALVYPCLLTCLAVAVLSLLLLFVIPRFAELFAALDVPLPPSTRTLISLSAALQRWWWALVLAVAIPAVAIRTWTKTPAGRRAIDTWLIRLPQIGSITRNFATARIVRLLGVLIDSNVPLLEALDLTGQGMSNTHYTDLVRRAREAVTRGEPMSSAFADEALISPSVYEAMRSGEHSGQVGPLLLTLADFLDDENETVLRSLTSIVEPVILILMGLLVGAVALSLFMPLFDLTAMTSGGAA
jgi:type II secretory pathway component PulF